PSCNTAPTSPLLVARCGDCLRVFSVPVSGSVNPNTMSSRVVLPAPLGPSRANTSPELISRLTLSTAVTAPKRLVTAVIWMADGEVCILSVFPTGWFCDTASDHLLAMTDVTGPNGSWLVRVQQPGESRRLPPAPRHRPVGRPKQEPGRQIRRWCVPQQSTPAPR